jgi:hypothetical protein
MSPVHIGLLVLWSKKFLKNKKLAASVEFKQTMYGTMNCSDFLYHLKQ